MKNRDGLSEFSTIVSVILLSSVVAFHQSGAFTISTGAEELIVICASVAEAVQFEGSVNTVRSPICAVANSGSLP
jgi:hypothetical protein